MFVVRILASILIVAFCLSFAVKTSIADNDKFLPLKKHLEAGRIKVSGISLGGHSGDCVSLELRNVSRDTLFLFLEPGRRLLCADTNMQDILLVKKKSMVLLPLAVKKINAYGFCCESSNRNPLQNASFRVGYMAPEPWIKVCEFINEHTVDEENMQSAVWVMSDNHPISSVHAAPKDSHAIQLRQLLGKIKGVEVPWYSQSYVQDTSVFSNRPDLIRGTLEYNLKNNAIVSIVVRDKWGTIAKTLVTEAAKGPGKQTYDLVLDVKGWGKGEYTITILEDYSNFNSSSTFRVE